MLISLLYILCSMYLIWLACGGFEIAANFLGRDLKDGVKGATINAIGSSIPELFATIIALVFYLDKDGFEFGIGTTAGSAIFNAAVIPAFVIITVGVFLSIKTIKISRKVVLRDGISLMIAEIALIAVLFQTELSWYHGLFLVLLYVAYITYTLYTMENDTVEDFDVETYCGIDIENSFRAIVLLIISIILISIACHILVIECYNIGDLLDIKVYFVSVILAAAATSVPDTIISIKDAMKGNYDDSISNALGSNIFDICFCIGFPLMMFGLITGQSIQIAQDSSIMDLRILLLVCTGSVFLVMLTGKMVYRCSAIALISVYAIFIYRIIALI